MRRDDWDSFVNMSGSVSMADRYYGWYSKPKAIKDQLRIFDVFLHNYIVSNGTSTNSCSVDESFFLRSLPDGAEGYFVLPRWQMVAYTYELALERVFSWLYMFSQLLLNHKRPLRFFQYPHWWAHRCYMYHHLPRKDSQYMLDRLYVDQNNPFFLVVPAQFGKRHAGKSSDQIHSSMAQNEFSLGAFGVGCMLLTHYERVQENQYASNFGIQCAGSEYIEHKFEAQDYHVNEGERCNLTFWTNDDVCSVSGLSTYHSDQAVPTGFVV